MHAGIIVGRGTIDADNPSLTVRLVRGPNPHPIVIDTHLAMRTDGKLMARNPVVVCADDEVDQYAAVNADGAYWLTAQNCKIVNAGEEKAPSSIGRLAVLLARGATVLRCKSSGAHVDLDDMTRNYTAHDARHNNGVVIWMIADIHICLV